MTMTSYPLDPRIPGSEDPRIHGMRSSEDPNMDHYDPHYGPHYGPHMRTLMDTLITYY